MSNCQQSTLRLMIAAGLLAAITSLPASPLAAGSDPAAGLTSVTVEGAIWHVGPVVEDTPAHAKATERLGVDAPIYMAVRQNPKLEAFRRPSLLNARQAARALRGATGCRVHTNTMMRTISGAYFARLSCD